MKQSIKLILALCLIAFGYQLEAQVKLVPRVGLNASAIDARLQDIRAEARVGWNAGLDFQMGDGFIFLRPGAHYYSYTTNLVNEVDIDDFKFEDETTVQSVKLPLNLGVSLTGKGGLLQVHAIGGVTPTFVMGVKDTPNFDFSKEDLNGTTWGANVGLGVQVLFLTVEANYEIGLTDYFKYAEGGNNVFTLSAGLKF
jgi:hypothetical protein